MDKIGTSMTTYASTLCTWKKDEPTCFDVELASSGTHGLRNNSRRTGTVGGSDNTEAYHVGPTSPFVVLYRRSSATRLSRWNLIVVGRT